MNENTRVAHWNELVEAFRSFGGTANNVIQKEGKFGLGLFPIDSSKPVELRVPNYLLVSTDNLKLLNGNIVLKDASGYPEGFAEWYEKFQTNYSWGADGKRSIKLFEDGLKSLPNALQQKLQNLNLLNIKHRYPGIDIEQELFERFICTRQINLNDNKFLMPMIELVNHSPSQSSWTIDSDSIAVQGQYEDEILVRYSVSDPIRRLLQYGFNCKEPTGFSLSFKLFHNEQKIFVEGGLNNKHFDPPEISIKNKVFEIRRPLLGAFKNPRIPKTIFRESCKKISSIKSDELFDQIHQKNILSLIDIIKELGLVEGNVAKQLREACIDQIEILSEHFGSIEIEQKTMLLRRPQLDH